MELLKRFKECCFPKTCIFLYDQANTQFYQTGSTTLIDING